MRGSIEQAWETVGDKDDELRHRHRRRGPNSRRVFNERERRSYRPRIPIRRSSILARAATVIRRPPRFLRTESLDVDVSNSFNSPQNFEILR